MKRFFRTAGFILIGLAALTGYRLSGKPWVPAAPFDVLGLLWLLQNFPKLMGWLATWALAGLGLMSFWYAHRLPGFAGDLESEERRLMGHLLSDPVRTGSTTAPPTPLPPSSPPPAEP